MPFFQQSERATMNGGTFIDIYGSHNAINIMPDARKEKKGKGIRLLLSSYVQREAIHDSGARGTLGCHPGTREEYIRSITSWGSGEWESGKRAFLMTGPAGAGKSAIARTCAYKIEAAGRLGASFFFFRPSGWNDPKKFLPTIVYQLATRYPAYNEFIDAIILSDRLVLEKDISIQFRELLVKPLQKLSARGQGIERDTVIIVDGLDECATVDAQLQIIDLITTSTLDQTTPFLWAFFSRPEPPITSSFASQLAATISWTLPLTLSGDADSDIEAYLHGSFQAIRAKYNIPTSVTWPMEGDICRLVSQSAGLFVYPVTAIRYIEGLDKGKPGLEERLRAVLQLDPKSTESPFSALDQLYILIMMLIPEGVLYDTMSLLHLDQSDVLQRHSGCPLIPLDHDEVRPKVLSYCFTLGLSLAAFHVAISNLYSVLEVIATQSGDPVEFRFYHKSFVDFLLDPKRCKQYFVGSSAVRLHCLEMIVRTMGTEVGSATVNGYTVDGFALQTFFTLVEEHDGELEENILQQISQINWSWWYRLYPNKYEIRFKNFIQKIPRDWRPRIVRPVCKGFLGILPLILAKLKPGQYEAEAYILGDGYKKCMIARCGLNYYQICCVPVTFQNY